ncbi:MAG: hypothetical protein K8U03_10080 [Planctomycetia bacterium]|nr:hypothetical protein [Planctomycetia bacterium]
MWKHRLVFVLAACLSLLEASAPSRAVTAEPVARLPIERLSDEERRRFSEIELLFCFQGKGSCLPYDAGVLHEAYARIPALRNNRVIVAGNSSGSIAAAFFSCFGFSDANVRHAEQRLTEGNRDAVRNMENPHTKFGKMVRGKPTEIGHEQLREYVAFALGVERWRDAKTLEEIAGRSTARPRFPLLIVSCNKETLEDGDATDGRDSARFKELDPETMTVSWRKEVYDFYRAHPDRFAQEHPNLKLGPDRRIGRGVTFFVDRSMYDLLRQIPAAERQADLRLVETAADVAFAIKASVSEPTYFQPVVDPSPEKILVDSRLGELGNVRQRSYYGGYIMALPAQDVRRMLPGIRTFGTGFRHFDLLSRSAVRDWLLADTEPVMQRMEWWADLQTTPDAEFESHMDNRDLTARQEFEFGRRRARECFVADQEKPTFTARPKFGDAAAAAVTPAFVDDRMFEKSADKSAPRTLKSSRGLGRLLASPTDSPAPGKAGGR